jgi:hypothetical protein
MATCGAAFSISQFRCSARHSREERTALIEALCGKSIILNGSNRKIRPASHIIGERSS